MTSDDNAEKLIVLSESFIMTFCLHDLQNIFIRSSTENTPDSSGLSIRTQKFSIPTPAPHYDVSCSSSELPTLFDQLVQASVKTSNKSDASIPPISPVQSTYVVTSDQPFISFFSLESANYGTGLSSFASLLYVHAKKSIFSGSRWKNDVVVRFTDQDGVPATPRGACHQVSASSAASGSEELHLNKALADQHRKVLPGKMAVSSDRCWLAIPDGLGRVLLVDAVKQRVVRMWKGYRDAQVVFLDVPCRNTDGGQLPVVGGLQVSYTRCLLIHAPRRRILELWRLTHGPRLAAWDAEEPVRLISSQPQCPDSPTSPSQGFILDSRGVVYTIEVSGELCLADSDAEAARGYEEYQVMQECYASLSRLNDQGPECVCSELIGLLSRFQTPSWFERSVLHVVHHLAQTPHALMDLLKDCLALLSSGSAEDGLRKKWSTSKPSEVSRLAAVVQQLLAFTEFYFTFDAVNVNCLQVFAENDGAHCISECDASNKAAEAIADLLNWDLVETEHCLQVYAFCLAIMPPASHLPSPAPNRINLSVFLDCFRVATVTDRTPEFEASAADLGHSPTTTVEAQLSSRSDELAGRLAKVGCLIFAPYLNGLQTFESLQEKLDHSVLPPDVLLYSLTMFLTSHECFHSVAALIDRTHRLYALLLASFYRTLGACASSQGERSGPSAEPAPTDRAPTHTDERRFRLLVDYLHDYCLQTNHLSSAYLVALVLRALLFISWQAIEQGELLSHAVFACCSRTSQAASSDSDFKVPTKNEGDSPASAISSSLLHDTVTQWHDTCTRMDGLFRLGLLVQLPGFEPKSLQSVQRHHRHDRTSDSEDSDCEDYPLVDTVNFPYGTSVKPSAVTWKASSLGFPISLGRVLYYGRACITELFASWITDCRVEPEHVISLYQGICQAPDAPASSVTGVSLAVELALPDSLILCQSLFGMVYKRLPFTLELDTVLASVAWLYAQRWTSLPEDITYLQMSVRFLESLSSAGAMIAQGLAKMIWFACLTPWIINLFRGCHEKTSTAATATSGRMNSISRPPHTLQKTIRMKDVSVLLMDFFAITSNACKCAEVVPVFSVEREWSIPPDSSPVDCSVDKASGQGDDLDVDLASLSRHEVGEYTRRRVLQRKQPAPLASVPRQLISEMAVDERPVGQAQIDFWEQVVIVAAAMVNFGPPGRPSQSRRSAGGGREQTDCYQLTDFFSDNQSRAITRDPIDFNLVVDSEQTVSAELQVRRRFFVSWLVERAVITCLAVLPLSQRHAVEGDAPSRRCRKASGLRRFCHLVGQSYSELELYRKFIAGATVLARNWGLSKQVVLTHHIISLLEANLDDQAQLYLSQVQNATSLATQLMIIVGRRVAWQCFGQTNNTSSQLRWRACIPFHLEAWLRGLLPEPFEQHPPVIDTSRPGSIAVTNLITLIDFVLDNLPDQANQLDVAESLRDAIYAARDDILE